MKFPCLLYKTPGPHRKPGGLMYAYIGCPDQAAFERLSADGWARSLYPEDEDDNAPPTRKELEAKATELGVNFDGRTTDKRLGERIKEALS
jgi:hypothetical protein